MLVKECTRCGETKSVEMFYRRTVASDGLDHHCRTCAREKSAAYRAANLERERAKGRVYAAKRRENHPRKTRDTQLRSVYGIGLDEFEELWEAQAGLCAICHLPPSGSPPANHTLHIDHCHKTGRVRGLLCGPCNRGLGLFSENPATLSHAAQYLISNSMSALETAVAG